MYEFIRGRADFSRAKSLLEELVGVIDLDNKVIIKATEIWRKLRKEGQVMDIGTY